jgi:hypothetical protein
MRHSLARSAWLLLPALLAALAFAVPASASPDGSTSVAGVTSPALLALIGNDDLFSTMDLSTLLDPPGPNGTQHYGPYASDSSDSGTCGVDWANDTFDRHFTVRPDGAGGNTVVEQFKDGSFVTNDAPSPGACEGGTHHGALITAGKTGGMHGYFIISNVGIQTSTDPHCNATLMTDTNCTTQTFIETHFACTYQITCPVTTFFFHYAAGDQSLLYHEWKNASDDRGGNGGDIASS